MKTHNNCTGKCFQYVKLADLIEEKINDGIFRVGDKLPSLRQVREQTGKSISTVHQAYIELENRNIVESKEKSGFYVKAKLENAFQKEGINENKLKTAPARYTRTDLAHSIIDSMKDESLLQMGVSSVSPELTPVRQISRLIHNLPLQQLIKSIGAFEDPEGTSELRDLISKRMVSDELKINCNDIITTNGCLDAINLSLRAVAKRGDTILVESPVFYGFLQLIEVLGMYVLEVPTDPETGIKPEILEEIIKNNEIKACLLNTNFHNPLGYQIPDETKKAIVETITSKGIPIIEDDVYGELYFGKNRPTTLKSFDTRDMVLYCSSFSKTLPTGLRVGWAIPGKKFHEKVRRLKLNTYLASSRMNQIIIAEFLKGGYYDRHLRQLRKILKSQSTDMREAIKKYFPDGVKVSVPRGGLSLWIELPQIIDGLTVYKEAMKQKISIVPGIICSTTEKYSNFLRFNFGYPWNREMDQGIKKLANICQDILNDKI